MKIVRVDPAVGAALQGIAGRSAKVLPFARGGGDLLAGVLHLGPGGTFGPHAASIPRVLLIVRGAAAVRPEGGEEQGLSAGDALFWEAGETLRVASDQGCIALFLEARDMSLALHNL